MDGLGKQTRTEQNRTETQAREHHGRSWGPLRARSGALRGVVMAVALSVTLNACSAVPDVVNPVSWYEKTTDFFSGDSQAAETGVMVPDGQNQGLSADPNAPPPVPSASPSAPRENAGLSADQGSGNYASPAIARQGAPSNVLQPQTEVANAPSVMAPKPAVQPRAVVTSAPLPTPSPAPSSPAMVGAPKPLAATVPPPSMPALTTQTGAPGRVPAPPATPSTGPLSAPPPFEFPPALAADSFANDSFETVVISAQGMATPSELGGAQRFNLAEFSSTPSQASATTGALQFPQSGRVVQSTGLNAPGNAGAMTADGMVRVATINFANNAVNLDRRDRSILSAVVQLQKERGGRVVVVGHASSRTRDMDYVAHQMVNLEISMNRAGRVGSELTEMGLPTQNLDVQAVSDSQPLYLEVMPSGEAGNRRVEIYLSASAT